VPGRSPEAPWVSSRRRAKAWKVAMVGDGRACLDDRRLMSAAVRREKVRTKTSAGAARPFSIRWRARRTRNSVLPVPGPATMICGPSVSSRAFSQSEGPMRRSGVPNVIRPTYRPLVTETQGGIRPGLPQWSEVVGRVADGVEGGYPAKTWAVHSLPEASM
jgi:hypothetical protein